ncbi:MAG: TatD family hydrolase [Proteobacteria bacterium]|nr:TatD family hydrolase [Pseudomonadota bacterium]
MTFIDTHCHLDFPEFDGDREKVLRTCEERNVRRFILPGVTRNRWESLVSLGRNAQQLYIAPGLHPAFTVHHRQEDLAVLAGIIEENRDIVVGIGETGLDFFYKGFDADTQIEYFTQQVTMAGEAKLPLILHVRKAHDQAVKILRSHGFSHRGIVHCYSGSLQQAGRYLDLGFKLGVGGVVTYERSTRLRKTVSELPLSSFVLETDAPDIPVNGRQGERNSPEYLPEIFGALATFRNETEEEVRNQLYHNTIELFPALEDGTP